MEELSGFVELNRSFAEIPHDHTFGEDDYDTSLSFGFTEPKKWDDLLQLQRVIILAEAGAGKTEEIRAATFRMRNEGHKAFFFRLEHLSDDFEASFEIGTPAEFNEWLLSEYFAYFFLDSVDEAKQQNPKQFELAIRKFSIKLGDKKDKAKIFITSRPSEWRPKFDFSLIEEKLPMLAWVTTSDTQATESYLSRSESSHETCIPSQAGRIEPVRPTIFSLCRLNENQIQILSKAHGIKKQDEFLRCLNKTDTEIFARRPQDLLELINYWKLHGEIANRAKLIEAGLTSKLTENDPDRDIALPLTLADAELGAEMLAAAVTFQRKSRILVPEQNTGAPIKAEAFNAKAVLSDWTSDKIRALLQRPIFDKAIYGAVRFHERRMREYLTAKWLHRLLVNNKKVLKLTGYR